MLSKLGLIIEEVGGAVMFGAKLIKLTLTEKMDRKLLFQQIDSVSFQSLPIVAMSGFFVGAIMTVQFALQMAEFGALGYLGGLATSGTIREVGPLLIAFMLSGKIGAFTSAELGTMRVTEQIDAVKCLGSDPMVEMIVPRFWGIIISSFFLLSLGLLMSILGGALMGQLFAGVSLEEYLRHIPTIVTLPSIFGGLVKCLVFATILATLCTYFGYNTTGGAKGVGRSVIKTSVMTMVSIVIADWATSFLQTSILEIVRGLG